MILKHPELQLIIPEPTNDKDELQKEIMSEELLNSYKRLNQKFDSIIRRNQERKKNRNAGKGS